MPELRRIAYVPARSGSRGVPRKNIRPLLGRPLLWWIVQAAAKTGLFDRIMVSTDSEEFAEVARRSGAWVPFLRHADVARDTTPTIDTVCSDKGRLEAMGESFGTFCLLEATSPLCRPEDIAGAVALHERVNAGVVSLVRTKARPLIMRRLDGQGRAIPILESREILRRQDEPAFYQLNAAIYVNAWSELAPGLKLGYNPYGYVMDEVSSIDVDTLADFELAEREMRKRLADGGADA